MADEHQHNRELLEVFLDADREIAAAAASDSYRLYECLHRAADRLACADAFYICLYGEADQSLLFPYNYDNGVYDFPSTYPLGNGPTSWVIRHREPFIWNTTAESGALRGIHFGNLETSTASAVHLPMPRPGAGPEAPLLGVLSAQSYRPHAYDPLQVRLLQWLADRAASAITHAQTRLRQTEQPQQAVWIADQCVQMINRIGQDAQALCSLLPTDPAAPREAAAALLRACYRAQTEANQLPLHAQSLSLTTLAAPPPADPLAPLTEREREILLLLAAGHTNGEIARRLFIATNTVKDHLKRVFAKTGVASRHEAAAWFRASKP